MSDEREEAAALALSGRRGVVFTVLEGPGIGRKRIFDLDTGHVGGSGPAGLVAVVEDVRAAGRSTTIEFEGVRVLAELFGPPVHLVIVGAYDIAEELCFLGARLGWRSTVVDARETFLTRERVPSADRLVVGWPQDALPQVGLDTDAAVLVLSHDLRFDVPALAGATASTAFYVGALGSRRTQERRAERLDEAGVDAAAQARIHGPCGLDVGGASPAETAVSIVAEILAVRAGRGGGPLRSATGPVHPAAEEDPRRPGQTSPARRAAATAASRLGSPSLR
ncbi:XdhC family protein [Patulibacter sp.]|uniref:XdhC family protein n=1 Tax=Patulibacter sp. TaxID=1912859 RepID=UPI002722A74B|nr:XdhC family protein [Patulibacter sp.]MDO9408738.1 XdhC family protein [Patulibacter sp.]